MKKLFKIPIIFILLFSAVISFSACSKPDLCSRISELRKDIFTGESENFMVVVYSGTKEEPAIFDGEVNPSSLSLLFKVTVKEEIGHQLSIKFRINDKEYQENLAFNPVESTLCSQINVENLPEKNLDIEIIHKNGSEVVLTKSMLKDDTINYITALDNAGKKAEKFIKTHSKNGILHAEIIVRLLSENDINYYYVGFIDEKGLIEAYLIDGKSGEILAEKKNQ